MNPAELTDADFRRWFITAPTQAEVAAQLARTTRAQAAAHQAERRAGWRELHPEATCRDPVVDLLIDLEEYAG